jgi:hypothetical protein
LKYFERLFKHNIYIFVTKYDVLEEPKIGRFVKNKS